MSSPFWDPPNNLGIRPSFYPDYYTQLATMLNDCAVRGICPQLVIFGDCHGDMTTASRRQQFVADVAQFMAAGNYQVFMEIANEASVINIPPQETLDLTTMYKSLDPGRLVTAGGGHGDDGTTPGSSLFFNQPPADYCPFQCHREDTWRWVMQYATYPPVLQTSRPPVEEEPMNAGPVGGTDQFSNDPAKWYAFGAVAQILRFSTTFHFDLAFRLAYTPDSDLVPANTFACFQQWQLALNSISFDLDGAVWAVLENGSRSGDSPLTGLSGAGLIVGRHNGVTGQGIVMNAPGGWAPAVAAGWTVTIAASTGGARRILVSR